MAVNVDDAKETFNEILDSLVRMDRKRIKQYECLNSRMEELENNQHDNKNTYTNEDELAILKTNNKYLNHRVSELEDIVEELVEEYPFSTVDSDEITDLASENSYLSSKVEELESSIESIKKLLGFHVTDIVKIKHELDIV